MKLTIETGCKFIKSFGGMEPYNIFHHYNFVKHILHIYVYVYAYSQHNLRLIIPFTPAATSIYVCIQPS